MKYFAVGVSFASVAAAQIVVNGVSSVPYPTAAAGSSSDSGSVDASAYYTPSAASTYYGSSYPAQYTGSSSAYGYESSAAYTYTAAASAYTPPPSYMSSVYSYQESSYSSFVGGGYSSMDCAYGYSKAYDGSCSSMSWVSNVRSSLTPTQSLNFWMISTRLQDAT